LSQSARFSQKGVSGNFATNLPKLRLSIPIENVRRKCCERPYSTISSMASVLNKPPHEPRSSPGYIVERAECAHPCALNRRILRRLCRNLNRSEPHVSRPLHPAGCRFARGGSQQHPVLRREAQSALQLLWRSRHMLVPCANGFSEMVRRSFRKRDFSGVRFHETSIFAGDTARTVLEALLQLLKNRHNAQRHTIAS